MKNKVIKICVLGFLLICVLPWTAIAKSNIFNNSGEEYCFDLAKILYKLEWNNKILNNTEQKKLAANKAVFMIYSGDINSTYRIRLAKKIEENL